MPEDAGSVISPNYCLHCFCEKDEDSNPRCCKCGAVVLEEEAMEDEVIYSGQGNTPALD